MSNEIQGLGIVRGAQNPVDIREVEMDLPNGRTAVVRVSSGVESSDAEDVRQNYLETVHAPSLTEGLEREVKDLAAKFQDFSHYDRDGNAVMRVQGRERELLETKLANRTNALQLARRTRAQAEQIQAAVKRGKQETEQRIEAAARVEAQRLIEEAEVTRRAKQIAARAGV